MRFRSQGGDFAGTHYARDRARGIGADSAKSRSQGSFPSRRRVLHAAAGFGTGAVATALEASTGFAQTARPAGAKADIVFRNGPVYTVNSGQARARAVAVRGKRIVYVGDDAGAQGFVGQRTRVVDPRGGMLLPGFVEEHIHPVAGAVATRGVDLQYDTRDEILGALEACRSKSGKIDVIRGFGWRYSAFAPSGPRKDDLDRIWPDVPVMLLAIDGHSGWVNSKTLELAGVTGETPDPIPGFSYFRRDPATGEANGYLVEIPVLAKVMMAAVPVSRAYITQSLEEWASTVTRPGNRLDARRPPSYAHPGWKAPPPFPATHGTAPGDCSSRHIQRPAALLRKNRGGQPGDRSPRHHTPPSPIGPIVSPIKSEDGCPLQTRYSKRRPMPCRGNARAR